MQVAIIMSLPQCLRILDPSLFHRNIHYGHLPLPNSHPIISLTENETRRPAGGHMDILRCEVLLKDSEPSCPPLTCL